MDGKVRIGTELNTNGVKSGLKNIKSLIAGAGLAKMMQMAITSFAEYETVLRKSSTLFGDVAVDTKNLESQILSLSSATGETTQTIGEGLYTALSAGVPVTEDMGEAMAFMAVNTKLAKAGFTDVETSVSATAKVLNAYKMDTSEIDKVSNILIATQNKGITTVGELGQQLAQVTPTASAMGVSFEEVGASLATMTAQGTPTTQATTQLRQVLAELGKSGTIAADNLEKAALSAGMTDTSFGAMIESGTTLDEILALMSDYADASNLSMIDLFSSIQAGQGALSLSGANTEKFTENLEYMRGATGLVDEAYEKMGSTLTTQASRIKSSFSALSLSIMSTSGTMLSDIAGSMADLIEDLRIGFEDGGFEGMISALIDSVSEGFKTLLTKLEAKLPEWFNLGLDMVGEIVGGIYTILPEISGKIWGTFARLINGIFTNNESKLKTVGSNMVVSISEGIASMMSGLAAGFKTLGSNIVYIFKNTNFKAVGKDLIKQVGDGVSETAKNLLNKTWLLAKGIGNMFKNAFKIAFTKVTFQEVFEEQFAHFLSESELISLDGEIDTVSGFAKAMEDAFKLSGNAAMENSEVITNWADAFSKAYKKADDSTEDLTLNIDEIITAVSNLKQEAKNLDGNSAIASTTTKSFEDLGNAVKEGLAGAIGLSNDEFDLLLKNLDNAESVFDKAKIMATSVSDVMAASMLGVFDDIGDALADVTFGTKSWGDAALSVASGVANSLGDILKEMAKQLAGIAVAKAITGDWGGAGLAAAGAIALGYGGALLQKVGLGKKEEEQPEVTYESTKKAEAETLKGKITTTEKDMNRARDMANKATSGIDKKYYTEMYVDLGKELTELKKKLQFAQGFSTGGIVGGNSYNGDKLLAFVNSKELIFNQNQQANLANKLDTLGKMASGTTLVVNVNGDTFGVDDFYNKVYNGIRGLQFEGALQTW